MFARRFSAHNFSFLNEREPSYRSVCWYSAKSQRFALNILSTAFRTTAAGYGTAAPANSKQINAGAGESSDLLEDSAHKSHCDVAMLY
jgi:hypothetical protein